MNKILDYIISLANLYGLVHKDKVIEIYNMQKEEKIDEEAINDVIKSKGLKNSFIEIYGDYFVVDSILEFDNFEEQLKQRAGKPFYIPEQEELFNYREDTYFEVTKEYYNLLMYLTKNIFQGDEFKAEMLSEDIQGICQFTFSLQLIFDEFNRRDVNFKDEKQINEVIQLIMELANNTRLWENNGHTPRELGGSKEKSNLIPFPNGGMNPAKSKEKVGRNDPCPCGSGKKYKKCCALKA